HGNPGGERNAARRGRVGMGALAMGRLAFLAAAALLVLGAAACGGRREPTGAQTALYPVTAASPTGGKALVVKAPAKRIAVISPSARDVLLALGAKKAIAGLPLARNGNLDVDRLKAFHPDLLVASSTTDDQMLAQAAAALRGVPVYRAPDDSIRG